MKKVVYCTSLFTVLVLTGCSQSKISKADSTSVSSEENFTIVFEKEKTILPLEYRNGMNPVVKVKINGKGPYKFLFDTGCQDMLRLDVKVFSDLNLPIIDSIMAGDGSGKVAGYFPITKIDQLQLGDFTIKGSEAMVRNYNHSGIDSIDGVFGLAFFDHLLVQLDFENDQMIISEGNLSGKDENVVPITFRNGIPVVKVKLGAKEFDADFDTGNMGTLTFFSSNISDEMMASEPKVIGQARTISGSFDIKSVELKDDVHFAGFSFKKPTVALNDVMPHNNMGILFSRQMNITFDKTNKYAKFVLFKNNTSSSISSDDQSKKAVNESGFSCETLAGRYANREVSCENGELYMQRILSAQDNQPDKKVIAPKFKLIDQGNGEYTIGEIPNSKIKFVKNNNGVVTELHVLNPAGEWEKTKRN